jgi:hypothetical protein
MLGGKVGRSTALRTALSSVITQQVVVISWLLKLRPTGCPETSIRNYNYSLHNKPEDCSSHLLRSGSLASRIAQHCATMCRSILGFAVFKGWYPGKTASEKAWNTQLNFNNNAIGRTQTFEWFSIFKSGDTTAEDSFTRLLSTDRGDENLDNVRKIVKEDLRSNTFPGGCQVRPLLWTCQRITKDMDMRRIFAKFVLQLLTSE